MRLSRLFKCRLARSAFPVERSKPPARSHEEVQDPRRELRTLIDRGKVLIQEAEGIAHASKSLDPNVRLGVGVFDLAVGLEGRKRLATALGKTWLRGNLVQRYSSLTKNFDQWYTETVAALRRI